MCKYTQNREQNKKNLFFFMSRKFLIWINIKKPPDFVGRHFYHVLRNLFQLSEILNGANHLRSVRVLIVVPSNNLYERVAVTDLRNHGLVSVEQ